MRPDADAGRWPRPFLWVATGVPSGLSFGSGGALTGSPTSAGAYALTIAAFDDSTPPQVAQQRLSFTIH